MAAPKTTTWPLEPHTRAKHEILRRYLQAWTPILSASGVPLILYIDGFAGPGRYDGGEDGSPVIALKAALQHKSRIQGEVRFLFIEDDRDRAEILEKIVGEIERPQNFKTKVDARSFEDATAEMLGWCRSKKQSLPPTFAFVDPFGWKVPFELVREVLSYPKCEVLVNFMYEEINRFLGHPDQEGNLDRLFGTTEWRAIVALVGPQPRRQAIHDLYLRQLGSAAKFVRSFEMRNDKDVTDYFLFFATNSRKGLQKMKESMWKVDPGGEFRFSDATNPDQALLFEKEPNLPALRALLVKKFTGLEVAVNEIEEFVVDATPFHTGHYKRVLRDMELATPPGLTPVNPSASRRKGTFADPKLRVRFS